MQIFSRPHSSLSPQAGIQNPSRFDRRQASVAIGTHTPARPSLSPYKLLSGLGRVYLPGAGEGSKARWRTRGGENMAYVWCACVVRFPARTGDRRVAEPPIALSGHRGGMGPWALRAGCGGAGAVVSRMEWGDEREACCVAWQHGWLAPARRIRGLLKRRPAVDEDVEARFVCEICEISWHRFPGLRHPLAVSNTNPPYGRKSPQ